MHIYNHSLQVVNNAVELANRFHVRKEIKNNLHVEVAVFHIEDCKSPVRVVFSIS